MTCPVIGFSSSAERPAPEDQQPQALRHLHQGSWSRADEGYQQRREWPHPQPAPGQSRSQPPLKFPTQPRPLLPLVLLQEEHLAQLEEASQRVEARYRHFFDRLLVHQETQEAAEELTSIIQESQEEAQWCPVSWRHGHHSGGA